MPSTSLRRSLTGFIAGALTASCGADALAYGYTLPAGWRPGGILCSPPSDGEAGS